MRITIEIDGDGVRVSPAGGAADQVPVGPALDGGAARADGGPSGDDRLGAEPAREVPGPTPELTARIEAVIGAAGPAADAGGPRVG